MKIFLFLFSSVFLFLNCSTTECSLEYQSNSNLANTVWRLKTETYNYANGVTENYTVAPNSVSGSDYYFVWEFKIHPEAVIHHSPYTWDETVEWNLQTNILFIIHQTAQNLIENHYEIIEMNSTYLTVKFINHNVISSVNGEAISVFYEFDKI